MTSPRYTIHAIENENCDSLDTYETLARAEDMKTAKALASKHSVERWGAGILDHVTGQIDVGFGFGVPCPDVRDDDNF